MCTKRVYEYILLRHFPVFPLSSIALHTPAETILRLYYIYIMTIRRLERRATSQPFSAYSARVLLIFCFLLDKTDHMIAEREPIWRTVEIRRQRLRDGSSFLSFLYSKRDTDGRRHFLANFLAYL